MDERLVDAHVRALIELHAQVAARGAGREICEQITPGVSEGRPARDAHGVRGAQGQQEPDGVAGLPGPSGLTESGEREDVAVDPLLATLAQAVARREAADGLIRLLVAYAREVAPSRYPLTVLAKATGISPSGLRTSYSPDHLDLVHQALAEVADGIDDPGTGETAAPAHDAPDVDLATVTSLLDRLTGPSSAGDVRREVYLTEEQLRARLREILLGDD